MHPMLAERFLPLSGPIPRLPLLGHILAMQSDPLRFMDRLSQAHSDIATFSLGPIQIHLVVEPELIGEVLREKGERYGRGTRVYQSMIRFLGRGILTSEGEHWRKHRRIVQPGFHPRRLNAFAEVMTRKTSEAIASWGDEIFIRDEMMRLTLAIVGDTLFGTDTQAIAKDIGDAVDAGQRYAERYIGSPFVAPDFIPTRANRELTEYLARMDKVVYEIIDDRIASSERGDDVLSMLVDARDEDGQPLPREQIRDEVITLISAGHETTANALAWAFYRLSCHPRPARQMRDEVDRVLEGRAPGFEDYPKLVEVGRVFDETLRLHPPAWVTGRVVKEDHLLGGHSIRKGEMVMLSPWVAHRDPRFWRDPEGFDPDRWESLGEKGALHPFRFFPFGGGPRKCVGAGFAKVEGVMILARIAQAVQLELIPGQRVEALPQITLGMRDDLRMRVRRR